MELLGSYSLSDGIYYHCICTGCHVYYVVRKLTIGKYVSEYGLIINKDVKIKRINFSEVTSINEGFPCYNMTEKEFTEYLMPF